MNTQEKAAIEAATAPAEVYVAQLDVPILRGETLVDQVTIRRPEGGDLRGLSLGLISMGDFAAMCTLIPRISTPPIFKKDIESGALDAADFMDISAEIINFFRKKSDRAKFQTE